MRLVRTAATVAIAIGSLAVITLGTHRGAEHSLATLETYVGSGRIGPTGNAWLVRQDTQGKSARTALIFGYDDDMRVCMEIANSRVRKNPDDRYECETAN